MSTLINTILAVVASAWFATAQAMAPARADGELEISVVDHQSGAPLPARLELQSTRSRPVKLRVGEAPLGDHMYIPGKVVLPLRRGQYRFVLDAGPEFKPQQGHFEIERRSEDSKEVRPRRFATLANEGWWGADLVSQRLPTDLPIVAAAEGLHYVPTCRWSFERHAWRDIDRSPNRPPEGSQAYAAGRSLGQAAAVVHSPGGSLLFVADDANVNQTPPFDPHTSITNLDRMRLAKTRGWRVVAMSPSAWEFPVWVAAGFLDGVLILGPDQASSPGRPSDVGLRPRDRSFYPGGQGESRWREDIYLKLVDAGVRLPPLAGSGSGWNERPLGTSRVYAFCGDEFSAGEFWHAVAQGRTVVTNGPLLRPSVGGDAPGATFAIQSEESIDFQIGLNLASRQRVEYLEIIKNGEPVSEVRLADWAKAGGRLPPISFKASGWFAIRAATDERMSYQRALSAPYYVQSPSGPRVSETDVRFFIGWLDELEARLGEIASCSPSELDAAREFWLACAGAATDD